MGLNMGLVVRDVVRRGDSPLEGVSEIYIRVRKKYLSEPYHEVRSYFVEVTVEGQIVDIRRTRTELTPKERESIAKHLLGRELGFHLVPADLGEYDLLYLAQESWSVLRDAGVLPDEYSLSVKLIRIRLKHTITEEEKTLELYPIRDVEAR